MRHPLVALAIVSFLAGCTANPPETPSGATPRGPPIPAPFAVTEPTEVAPVPNTQREAVVTVSADGKTILTCFHGSFIEASPGYASVDGGATWTRMGFPPEAGVGGDCETAMTASGAWAFLGSTAAGATVLVTRDQGQTWTVNPVTAIPINGLADRPWLEAVGEELWLAYMPLNFQPGTVGFTKSTDYAETWTTPVLVGDPGPGRTSVRHGHLLPIGEGAAMIPMVRYDVQLVPGAESVVEVATTTDGGATWTIESLYQGADIVPNWPSMALTGSGDLLVAFNLRNSQGGGALAVLHRPPAGEWTGPIVIHDAEQRGVGWPWIDGGAGPHAAFLVEGREDDSKQQLWIGRLDVTDMSVEEIPLWEDPNHEFGSVDHDAEGRAYAVWIAADEAQYFVKSVQ